MNVLPANHHQSTWRVPRRGHALLLTLLILLLTAAVAFGVLSIGRHARVKEMTHYSAQAGAESGASWVARSLNTVAMNNNAMAQFIAQAGIYQAMPSALKLYDTDLKSLEQVLKQIDIKDLPRDWQPIDKANPIALGYNALIKSTTRELKLTQKAERFIKKQISTGELSKITHVRPDAASQTPGTLWQAVNALDEINQAILENLEIQTQLAVLRGSILDTTARQTEASALLIPSDNPLIPWQRGKFSDFAQVIYNDQTFKTGMGYYDTTFSPNISQMRKILNETQLTKPHGPRGKCPISIIRASQLRQTHRPHSSQYSESQEMTMPAIKDTALMQTLGPLFYRLDNQRLAIHLQHINAQFMDQLWPNEKRKVEPAFDSKWITDPQQIYQTIDQNPQSVREIAFVTVQIKSAFAPTDPKFRSEGSWTRLMEDNANSKSLPVEYHTWQRKLDPRRWGKLGIKKLNDRIWRDVWTYQAYQDRSINLRPLKSTATHKHPKQTVYRVDDYMLVGINVGKPMELESPYNFPANESRPAPMIYVRGDSQQNAASSDQIQRTVVAQNHVRALPWSTPVAPTETASPMIEPCDMLVNNANNQTLWFQGWAGQIKDDLKPNLADAVPTHELEPLVSGKLFESVLTQLRNRNAQPDKPSENEVP